MQCCTFNSEVQDFETCKSLLCFAVAQFLRGSIKRSAFAFSFWPILPKKQAVGGGGRREESWLGLCALSCLLACAVVIGGSGSG